MKAEHIAILLGEMAIGIFVGLWTWTYVAPILFAQGATNTGSVAA